MTAEKPAFSDTGTTSADYDSSYYRDAHLGGHGEYSWDSEPWRAFFMEVARRLAAMLEPRTVLDVGCAKGMLVQALVRQGVEAYGFDVSEFAVENAHPDVRARLSVASATQPIEGRYDLITCVEVLEHMAPADAQSALDAMCSATDRILFSSTPSDFAESTHINVHPTSQWAAWFAERGFYRRTDLDTSFLTSWSAIFERADLSRRSIVERYESHLAPLNQEVIEKRQALLEANRQLSAAMAPARQVEIDDEAVLARHAELVARDNVLGLEATITRLTNDLRNARGRINRLRTRLEEREREVKGLRSSRTWRVGRMITRPLGRYRA